MEAYGSPWKPMEAQRNPQKSFTKIENDFVKAVVSAVGRGKSIVDFYLKTIFYIIYFKFIQIPLSQSHI